MQPGEESEDDDDDDDDDVQCMDGGAEDEARAAWERAHAQVHIAWRGEEGGASPPNRKPFRVKRSAAVLQRDTQREWTGGLTREVQRPLPSNHPRCDQAMPFQLKPYRTC